MLGETSLSILHPIMAVEISVPQEHFGNVLSDIANVRKGNIKSVVEGHNSKEKIIQAEVPLKAIIGYSTTIRSLSQGTASFVMDFLRYGELTEQEVTNLKKEYGLN